MSSPLSRLPLPSPQFGQLFVDRQTLSKLGPGRDTTDAIVREARKHANPKASNSPEKVLEGLGVDVSIHGIRRDESGPNVAIRFWERGSNQALEEGNTELYVHPDTDEHVQKLYTTLFAQALKAVSQKLRQSGQLPADED
jgi:hypothetical protein